MRRIFCTNRKGRAGKDDRFKGANVFGWVVVGMNFTIDEQFTNTTSNQLGVLRTKVEDQYFFFHAQKYNYSVGVKQGLEKIFNKKIKEVQYS